MKNQTKPRPCKTVVPVLFVVQRESNDERTFAVVTANVRKELANEATFLAALQKALNKWVETTKEGKTEWESSSEDFNVGDLSNCDTDGELGKLLADVGIHNLNIETFCNSERGAGSWTYDTVLMQPDEDRD